MKRILTLPNERRMFSGLDARSNPTRMTPGGSSPTFAIAGQEFQSFTIDITNNSGTLQARLLGDGIGVTLPGGLANKVLAHGTVGVGGYVNLPTLSSSVGFGLSPVGLYTGVLSTIVLNVADQPPAQYFGGIARITLYDGNSQIIRIYQALGRRNVNGRVHNRPEFTVNNDMTGASVDVNTTLLPSTRRIFIQFFGFLA